MAQQAFYVGLDLTGNPIKDILDAVDPQDAPSLSQVEAMVGGAVAAIHPFAEAGNGIVPDLTQTAQVVSVDQAWLESVIAVELGSNLSGIAPIIVDNTTTPGSPIISIDPAVTNEFHLPAVAGPGIAAIDASQTIAVQTAMNGGIVADAGGVYVDVGAGLSRTPDGVAVNIGEGLHITIPDNVAVLAKAGGGILVEPAGVSVEPAIKAKFHEPAQAGWGIQPIDASQTITVNPNIASDPLFKTHDPVANPVGDTSITIGGTGGQEISIDPALQAKFHNPAFAGDTTVEVDLNQGIKVRVDELIKVPAMQTHAPATAGSYVLPIDPVAQVVGVDAATLAADAAFKTHVPASAGLGIKDIDATQVIAIDPNDPLLGAALDLHSPVTPADGSITVGGTTGQEIAVDAGALAGNAALKVHNPAVAGSYVLPIDTTQQINVDIAGLAADIILDPALQTHKPAEAGYGIKTIDPVLQVVEVDPAVLAADGAFSTHEPATAGVGILPIDATQVITVDTAALALDGALKIHNPAVAGPGITVDAVSQTVSVNPTPGGGVAADAGGVRVDVGAGLSNTAAGVAVNLGDGLVFGGTSADDVTVLAEPGGGITVSAAGISVDPIALAADPAFDLHSPVTAFNNSVLVGADQEISVNPAWVATTVPVTSVVGANGVAASAPVSGAVTVSAVVDPTVGNQLTASAAGLLVPEAAPIDFPVDDIVQGAGIVVSSSTDAAFLDVFGISAQISVDSTPQPNILTIGSDQGLYVPMTDLSTYATDIEVTAVEDAINARIDAITITGTGAAIVTEQTADQFVVSVPSLTLANTYVGSGTDTATIEADLSTRVPPVVSQAGDMYINMLDGAAFICAVGATLGANWIGLVTAGTGIVELQAADASVTVGGPTGPVATVQVSSALQSAINTSTTVNAAQDAAIALLEAAKHAAATGQAAIAVSPAQAVSLVIDPASTAGVVSQGTSGLKIDLSNYATSGSVHAAAVGTAGETTVDPTTQQVGLDPLFVDRVEALEGIDHPAAAGATGPGAGAIVVDAATQVVSLVTDPLSPATLTQSAAGLSVDLGTVGADSHVPAVGTLDEIAVDGPTQAVGLAQAFKDRIDAIEAVNNAQTVAIGDLVTDTHNPAAGTPTEITVTDDGTNQVVALDPALRTRLTTIESDITAIEGVNITQDTDIAALEAASHPAATAAGGAIAVDSDLSQVVSLVINPASAPILTQDALGLSINLGTIETDSHVPVTNPAGDTSITISGVDGQEIAVNPAWLATAAPPAPIQTITGTNGVSASAPDVNGAVTLAAVPDPAVGNQLVVTASGLLVPEAPIIDFPVDDVVAGAGVTVTSNLADEFTVAAKISADASNSLSISATDQGLYAPVTDLSTYATDAEVAAGDAAINTRIDAITITGNGLAVVTEPTPDQFVVDVPSLTISNTYVGSATDSISIEGDLTTRVPPITSQPGDMYINSFDGTAFVCSIAGVEWIPLAAAGSGIVELQAADASVTVGGGTGPVATVAVSSALQSQITASTSTNVTQDAAILALQADAHDPATGALANAVQVDANQVVGLVIDNTSSTGVVSQTAAGLKIDTSQYDAAAQDSHPAAKGTAGEIAVLASTQQVGLAQAFKDRIDALEGVSHDAVTNIDTSILVGGASGQEVSVNPAWLATAAPVQSLVGTNGVSASAPVAGVVTLATVKDPAANNTLQVSAAGLFVPVTDLTAYAPTLYVDAGDAAINDRIDNLSILGTGMAVVSGDSIVGWSVDVPAVDLSNTYVGPGTDSATIGADLAGRAPAIIPQAGDLYVNNTTGQAFLHSGQVAPGDWIGIAAAESVIVSVNDDGAGTLEVQNPDGPGVLIGLSAATKTEISTATTVNNTQDTRLTNIETVNTSQDADIAALQAASHVPAVAGAGIATIDPLSQVVALNPIPNGGIGADAGGVWVDVGVGLSRTVDGVSVNVGNGLTAAGAVADNVEVLAKPAGGVLVDTTGVSVDPAWLATNVLPPTPAPLTFAGDAVNGYTATATGPVGGVASVRINGCIATFQVCEAGGTFTVSSSVDPGVGAFLHFG